MEKMKRKEEERRKRKEQMERIQKEREKQALEAAEEDSFTPQERDLLRQKREDETEVEREFERLSVVAVLSASLMPFYISWLAMTVFWFQRFRQEKIDIEAAQAKALLDEQNRQAPVHPMHTPPIEMVHTHTGYEPKDKTTENPIQEGRLAIDGHEHDLVPSVTALTGSQEDASSDSGSKQDAEAALTDGRINSTETEGKSQEGTHAATSTSAAVSAEAEVILHTDDDTFISLRKRKRYIAKKDNAEDEAAREALREKTIAEAAESEKKRAAAEAAEKEKEAKMAAEREKEQVMAEAVKEEEEEKKKAVQRENERAVEEATVREKEPTKEEQRHDLHEDKVLIQEDLHFLRLGDEDRETEASSSLKKEESSSVLLPQEVKFVEASVAVVFPEEVTEKAHLLPEEVTESPVTEKAQSLRKENGDTQKAVAEEDLAAALNNTGEGAVAVEKVGVVALTREEEGAVALAEELRAVAVVEKVGDPDSESRLALSSMGRSIVKSTTQHEVVRVAEKEGAVGVVENNEAHDAGADGNRAEKGFLR